MARYYELSTDEQIWVMIRVKQGLMTMEDALEYVRSQHEQDGKASADPRCPTGPGPGGGSTAPKKTRLNPHSPDQRDRMSSRSRGRSLLKHFARQRSPPGEEDGCGGGGSRISLIRPKSVCSSILVDKEWQRSDELLDLMVAQGKISRDDRDDLLKKFATDRNFKSGDAQRMILANLVKTGRISIDDAVHYSRLLGIVASAETEARTIAEVSNAFQEKRVYNFGVYKYYKHRTCQRRILQIDFQACQLCNIQKGNLNRKFSFATVTDYESEEGLRFFIYFKDHHEYELEADTLEEKEKICRLLHLIVEQNKSAATGRVLTQADFRGTLSQCQAVIREGFLEKKNHNLYTTWTRRWVRIRQGELSYYKPDDDNQQALNILQLSREVNLVKKVNNNGFSISTRKKVYFFRVIVSGTTSAAELERHRDEWFKAIRYACGDRRDSVANVGEDVFNASVVTTTGSVKSQQENINTMLKGYYEELEALNSVVGVMDMKGEAKKTAMRLQQIIKHLESFITDYKPPPEDSRPESSSGNSGSLDTDGSLTGERPLNSMIENGISDQSSMDESASTKNTTSDSVRLSLIYRNSWAQFEGNGPRTSSVVSCKDGETTKHNSKLSNGPEKITLSPIKNGLTDIFPRNSILMNGDVTGGLETVPESKLENGVEPTVANSNAAFLEQLDADANGNKPSNTPTPNQNAPNNGHTPLILEDSLPPLPPPPPPQLERSFAIREKMPARAPPPPPPNNSTPTTTTTTTNNNTTNNTTTNNTSPTLSPVLPPTHFIPTGNASERLEFEKLFSSASVSPVLRRRMWQAAATTGNFTFKSPPPLPVRGSSENKVKDTLPKQDLSKAPPAPSEENQVPPPLPPRQSVFDPAEVELRNKFNAAKSSSTAKKYAASTNSQLPKKTKSPSQSFWRTFKSSKSSAAISKVFPSSASSSKTKDPPPLPPRQASVSPSPRVPLADSELKEEEEEEAVENKDAEGEETPVKNRIPAVPPCIPAPPAPPPPPVAAVPISRTFKVKSKVKMRPFHWNKISNLMVGNSIWKDARDLTETIDTDLLEHMYSEEARKQEEPTETSKKKLKSFLDPKVAQNLGIFLAGFKMDAEELKYRLTILSEQDGGLDPEHINVLRRYHPTAEDIETYRQFRETPHELEPTDQFMLQLCEIPHLKTRLDLLLIINEFPVQYEHLAPTIDNVLESLDVLCNSPKFVAVLEFVLAVGNFINSGCSKGIAMGFRLQTLTKLAECRAKDKNFTLLKFLVQQIHKHEPDLLTFTEELHPLMLSSDASIKALQAEVEVMKKDLSKVKKNASVLLKAENPPERDIAFCDEVEMFVESYEGKLADLQEKSDDMKNLFDQMLMRFGEPFNLESQEVFSSIAEFVKTFKREADLILVTNGKLNRRKSKKYASNPRKSMPRDSAIDSVTSLERSDSAESCPDQYDMGSSSNDTHNSVANLRKAFSADTRSAAGNAKRQGFIQDKSKGVSTPRTRKPLPKNPTKEGYMEKLSNAKSPLSSQWNRRYFELTTQGHLYYSKRKNEKNVESIYLRGCPVALEDDRTIVIQTEERNYKLKASSHEEAQEWLECLLVYTLKQANIPRRAHSQFPAPDFGM
ncbi:uncharacterized protein [Diadema antillarum]|uniref:uncharacterized protein n=1 Tax=Diadema antillarum TaxID=105358 RepID=UPI003A88BD4E